MDPICFYSKKKKKKKIMHGNSTYGVEYIHMSMLH